MFWKVAGTAEIHFRTLSNRRYCKSNPSRTASKQLFGKHSFETFPSKNKNLFGKHSVQKFPWKHQKPFGQDSFEKSPWKNPKIPVTRAVTNLQNFTLGLSPKKRDPQKSKGVHKKEGSQRSPNRAPRLSNQKSNLPPWFTSRVQKTKPSRVQ